MRKVNFLSIIIGYLYLSVVIATVVAFFIPINNLSRESSWFGDYRAIIMSLYAILMFYLISFFYYRIYLKFAKIEMGFQPIGSKTEMFVNVSTLIFLVIINPVIKSNLIPVSFSAILYRMLGAKIGKNTYIAGAILDPFLTKLGSNTIVGHNAVLYSHAIEGSDYELNPIEVGDNVTIGAHAVIMSGVKIGNNSIVAAGAVVNKFTKIGDNEIWGGIPARFLKNNEKKPCRA